MRDDDDEGSQHRRWDTDEPKKGTSPWVWVAVGVGGFGMLLVAGCVGIFALGVFGVKKAAEEQRRAEEQEQAAATYKPMTVDELIDDWKPNPVAAATRYKTDGVEVSGTLHNIDAWFGDESKMDLRGSGPGFDRVTIIVKTQKAKEGLARCKVGSRVVVKARSDGSSNELPWLYADVVSPAR